MMTDKAKPIAAVTVVCSSEGLIVKILYDGLGLRDRVALGQPFAAVVDNLSAEKAEAFLNALRERGAAFDWELNVPVPGGLRLLHFAGSIIAQGIFIAGATTRSDVSRVYEQLMCLCDDPAASLYSPAVAAPFPRTQIDGDSELYDDFARLNNELVTLQREFVKRTVELEKMNEQKNEFVGMAAHDLRNPLQIIAGYSKLLLEETFGSLTPEQHKFISAISRNSDFMLRLVTDLLYVSQFEAGKLQLDLRPTDLVELTEKNVDLNRLLAEQKRVRLTLKHEDHLPSLTLDPAKIEQVLNNLIQNAIKFSHPNDDVQVQLMNGEQGALIAVQDMGPGIPPAEMSKLFQPFQRTSVRSTGGEPSTGLGLAIAKKIVLGHGGQIWAESREGVGSTFYVSLPFTR